MENQLTLAELLLLVETIMRAAERETLEALTEHHGRMCDNPSCEFREFYHYGPCKLGFTAQDVEWLKAQHITL